MQTDPVVELVTMIFVDPMSTLDPFPGVSVGATGALFLVWKVWLRSVP